MSSNQLLCNRFITPTGLKWLTESDGEKFLATSGSHWFFETEIGADWLNSRDAVKFRTTPAFFKWLFGKRGKKILEMPEAVNFLFAWEGMKFLKETNEGRRFISEESNLWVLNTAVGLKWLNSDYAVDFRVTPNFHSWLFCEAGQKWLTTTESRDWARIWGKFFLRTERGKQLLETPEGQHLSLF